MSRKLISKKIILSRTMSFWGDVLKITVYHRLQYLLPGESVKMADTTRSGVSQNVFSQAFNECLPSKRKEFVFKCVHLLSMCVSLQNSRCMLHTTVKYCQLVLIKTTWTIEKCLCLHCLKVFPLSFRCQNIQNIGIELRYKFGL